MAGVIADRSGSPVTVGIEVGPSISAYVLTLADGRRVGRADFIDAPGDVTERIERIVFHTEVDPEFSGRGLSGLLVDAVLDDSILDGAEIVPVCPLFARHLNRHGAEFIAAGGRFRSPTRADLLLVGRAARERG